SYLINSSNLIWAVFLIVFNIYISSQVYTYLLFEVLFNTFKNLLISVFDSKQHSTTSSTLYSLFGEKSIVSLIFINLHAPLLSAPKPLGACSTLAFHLFLIV